MKLLVTGLSGLLKTVLSYCDKYITDKLIRVRITATYLFIKSSNNYYVLFKKKLNVC